MEKRPHPLNSLSAAEISEAVTIVKAAPEFQPNTRFTEISLRAGQGGGMGLACRERRSMLPTADVVMLDGKHVMKPWSICKTKILSDADQRRPRDGAAR